MDHFNVGEHPSILDHPLISERYFFPMKVAIPSPVMVPVDGAELACYHSNPHPGARTVVLFHGNGEVVADYIDLFLPVFDRLGLNCFFAEYRGYGLSSGVPMLAKGLDDTKKLLDFMGKSPEELIVFGRSIGSLYGLEAINYIPDISGLIIESGIADILERILLRVSYEELNASESQVRQEVKRFFDHKAKLSRFKGKTLIMHAQNDSLVPAYHGQQLFDWAPDPKMVKLFDYGDHNSVFFENINEYEVAIETFVKTLG